MKKRGAEKKLTLNRESLRMLEKGDLDLVRGGHSLADTLCVACTTIRTSCC